jgi:cytochrome c oxidase cbb3-type subunit 2
MKQGSLLFIGLAAAFGLSWTGVMWSESQLGRLAPYYDDGEGASFPSRMPGSAAAGQLVYRDLGCASCHTQQVRRPGFGSDVDRGWGDRQSVARDYIYQPHVQLGWSRTGPDLANLAGRKPSAPDADALMRLLYAGQGGMPAYPFLFEEGRVAGQASDDALKLTGSQAPAPGRQIVPTDRARSLVDYLLSLNTTYDYPEAQPVPAPGAKAKINPEAQPVPAPGASVKK